MTGSTAVVTIAHGRHRHLRRQHDVARGRHVAARSLHRGGDERSAPPGLAARGRVAPAGAQRSEDDRGLPLAAARNLGFAAAVDAGADVLVRTGRRLHRRAHRLSRRTPTRSALIRTVLWSGPITYLPADAADCRPADLARLDDPHPARPAPDPGRAAGWEPNPTSSGRCRSPLHARGLAPHRRLLRGLRGLRRRGHRPGAPAGAASRRRHWAGSATPAPTTSTTRRSSRRSSTSTTSCATGRSSPSAGGAGRWRAG